MKDPKSLSLLSMDLAIFFSRENRLPRLGDSPSPWRYRGWLLPYVFLIHELCPAVANRWGYYFRTVEAGKLLDEAIPQIAFGAPDQRVFSLLHDWSRLIGGDCGGWSDFHMLLEWLSWGLSLGCHEPHLAEAVNEKLYRQVNIGPLLQAPHDYLGDHVALGRARGWNPTGFYATPHPVVECMVRMTLDRGRAGKRDPRTLSVCDPCAGSGRMLLHASNYSLNLWGQDIDPLAISMCKINGALYAPWLSFPISSAILGTDAASLSPEAKPHNMLLFT